jgi:hypothetical protein
LTACGFLNFEYRYLDNLARGIHHTFAMRLFEEMTGAYVGLFLFPFVLWSIRLHLDGHTDTVRGTIESIKENVVSGHFLRLNRSSLVRIDFIHELEK